MPDMPDMPDADMPNTIIVAPSYWPLAPPKALANVQAQVTDGQYALKTAIETIQNHPTVPRQAKGTILASLVADADRLSTLQQQLDNALSSDMAGYNHRDYIDMGGYAFYLERKITYVADEVAFISARLAQTHIALKLNFTLAKKH
jgi:hypothetical protein